MRKHVKEFSDFSVNESISMEKLRTYMDVLDEEIKKYSPEDQLEMIKDVVAAMKEKRPDLVDPFFRLARVGDSSSPWNGSTGRYERFIEQGEVGFRPLRLQVGSTGHSLYGSFYSETDRKAVLDSLLTTANSIAIGSKYDFKLIQGKVRDYYNLSRLLYLAVAIDVDLEEVLKNKLSIEALRGVLVAKDLNII